MGSNYPYMMQGKGQFRVAAHSQMAIKDGKLYADPIQHPDKMGRQIVQLIMKYQAGEKFESETLIPATLYTKTEADQDPALK